MARPDSFNDLAKRKRKNPQDRGKVFEGEIKKSLDRLGGFTRRFPDILGVNKTGQRKNISAPSPPDYIHINELFDLLVECKAVKGVKDSGNLPTRVDFDTVPAHQMNDLTEFDGASSAAWGVIAFCLYNDGIKRTWIIPIGEWVDAMKEIGSERASVPLSWFTEGETWGRYEVEWMPGKRGACYDLLPVIEREFIGEVYDG